MFGSQDTKDLTVTIDFAYTFNAFPLMFVDYVINRKNNAENVH